MPQFYREEGYTGSLTCSHICHRVPIAAACRGKLASAFALMSQTVDVKTVELHIRDPVNGKPVPAAGALSGHTRKEFNKKERII